MEGCDVSALSLPRLISDGMILQHGKLDAASPKREKKLIWIG